MNTAASPRSDRLPRLGGARRGGCIRRLEDYTQPKTLKRKHFTCKFQRLYMARLTHYRLYMNRGIFRMAKNKNSFLQAEGVN